MVHTGSHAAAAGLTREINQVLRDAGLAYIFISHFESDECGGLGLLLDSFPEARPVCSAVTARQLNGFGFGVDPLIQSPGQSLEAGGWKLKFWQLSPHNT